MGLSRPVTAAALRASPEMALRYPGEVELRRDGADEGEGRGFDLADLSAGAERTFAASDDAPTIVAWFVNQLIPLGWADEGDGWLSREEGQSFLARVEPTAARPAWLR